MLQIEEFRLRMPGQSEEEGRLLSEAVARRVSRQLPANGGDRQLGRLDLRVKIPPGTSRDRMATLIAEAIVRSLQ